MRVLTRVFFFTVSVTLTFLTQSRPLLLHTHVPREQDNMGLFLFLTCGLYEEKPLTKRILKQVKRTKCYIPTGRLVQRYELRRKMCRHLRLQRTGLGWMSTLEPGLKLYLKKN